MTPKPLRTPTATLQFLVDFAQVDLATVTKTARRSLLRLLSRLLYPEQPRGRGAVALGKALAASGWQAVWSGPVARSVDALTDEVLPAMQAELYQLVSQVAEEQSITSVDLALTFTWVQLSPKNSRRWGVMEKHGPPRDLLLYRVMTLIDALGAGKLDACRSPLRTEEGEDVECGRVFVKVGRKQFCSPRCSRRDYMRMYRRA